MLIPTKLNIKNGELKNTYTLLATQANPLMAAIHNAKKRMPVVLKREDEAKWVQYVPIEQFAFPYDVRLELGVNCLIGRGTGHSWELECLDTNEILKSLALQEIVFDVDYGVSVNYENLKVRCEDLKMMIKTNIAYRNMQYIFLNTCIII